MHCYCIGDEETVRGFRMAGISGQVITRPDQAVKALSQALGRPDLGVIIVTDAVAATIPAQISEVRYERDTPLIVEIPGPSGSSAASSRLLHAVQDATGVRMDMQQVGLP